VVEDLIVEGEPVAADIRGEAVDADHEEKKELDHVPEVVNAKQEPVNPTLPQ
jgi:hypothetical protein